jgi:site-specific recombinase XerD
MIESLFSREYTRNIHRNAPFLGERETYLRHLQASGKPKAQLQLIATTLLHIIRVLRLTELRYVDKAEVREASLRWASEEKWQRNLRGREGAARRFMYSAQRWLRFHNLLVLPNRQDYWFDAYIEEFRQMALISGLRLVTCKHYGDRAERFLKWLGSRRTSIQTITVSDIDDFVSQMQQRGLTQQTVDTQYQALRCFFRYAEARSLCVRGFAKRLRSPVRRKRRSEARGPAWKDVRRLIASCDRDCPSDLRAKAMLLLCSIYGLRNGEVVRLCLKDFDWQNEVMTVRRSKSGRVQQFPIQYEVGEAIIAYLKRGRPQTTCRNLFMSQYPPYRQLHTVWPIIGRRMRNLGISSFNVGSHALRHACATELLRKGGSLKEIADFLGHRNLSSVGIYAKHDWRSLREVAKISLAGVS